LLALPGGHVNELEPSLDCAVREVSEETGLTIAKKDVYFVGLYDRPGRDPRGWTITHAYLTSVDRDVKVVAGDDAVAFKWVTMGEIFGRANLLAFDHYQIVCDAYEQYGNLYLGA
jgi:ADP-ribose pyrophosphatase YjhB (NUDIX family)